MTAAPAGATPVTTAHAAAKGAPASGTTSWVQFSNRYSGRCIDDPHQSKTAGQPLQQYGCNLTPAQQWEFETDANGYEVIWNPQSGMCMADEGRWFGDGVPVVQTYCDGSAAEEWDFVPIGGLDSTYYLQNWWNQQRSLSVPNWGVSNGDPLQLLSCGCGAYQQWIVTYYIDFRGSIRKTTFQSPTPQPSRLLP